MATQVTSTPPPPPPAPKPRKGARFLHFLLSLRGSRGVATVHYLTRTEAHTYAFSVAANAILSFFPFVMVLMWIVRNVFHSQAMADVIVQLLRDHLPAGQDLVVRSLTNARSRVKIASLVILLITSTGIFLPLEVAFNQIWGFTRNRSYLGNQIVSLLLAFSCGVLALVSIALAAGNEVVLGVVLLGGKNIVFRGITFVLLQVVAAAASVAIFFLVYWLLPNGKVPARQVLPAAVLMGILWEMAKFVYVLALPWLNFQEVYGPFSISITLVFWAFLSALMMLAGAHLAATSGPEDRLAPVSRTGANKNSNLTN